MRWFIYSLIVCSALFAVLPTDLAASAIDQKGRPKAQGPGKGVWPDPACDPRVFWDEEKGFNRIQCNSNTTCCIYEYGTDENGTQMIWCDCEKNGMEHFCCHTVLYIYPDDPDKGSEGGARGSCVEYWCYNGVAVCEYFESDKRGKCRYLGGH